MLESFPFKRIADRWVTLHMKRLFVKLSLRILVFVLPDLCMRMLIYDGPVYKDLTVPKNL